MASRTKLDFKKHATAPATPHTGDVLYWVNLDGDLVRRDSAGVDTVIGNAGEIGTAIEDAIDDHEEAADPHTQYLTADA